MIKPFDTYEVQARVRAADAALYRAKEEGRNRVAVANPAAATEVNAATPDGLAFQPPSKTA